MQTELLEMRKILSDILSGNHALKQAVREVNKMDMIKASLIVRNPKHQELRIDKILEGDLQRDVPVGDYVFIEKCCELVKAAYNNLEMGNSMNRELLVASYKVLTEDSNAGFRDNNPVVYAFNHVPPHCADINDRLARSFRKIYSNEWQGDVIACAMYVHNCIIDIWPFDEYNGELAIFAMNYYLMEQGLMPIDMPMQKQDYEDLVASCLKGLRPDEEYEFFRNAVTEKMKNTVEVCRSYV